MPKLIKILAASVGGGLVLGVGIRLGEALASQLPVSRDDRSEELAERLGELEDRLVSLAAESPAAIGSRVESRQIDALSEASLRIRGEMREWLEESVSVRMAEVETRLRADSERGQKQMLDAFAESVQTRVIQRISRLEDEVAGQSVAMSELRECSLRTEQSMQKLLGGIDKLIVRNVPTVVAQAGKAQEDREAESGPLSSVRAEAAADPEPPPAIEPPSFAPRAKSRGWKIFGAR